MNMMLMMLLVACFGCGFMVYADERGSFAAWAIGLVGFVVGMGGIFSAMLVGV